MTRQLIISGIVFSLLASCSSVSQSKINPLNWFGPSEPAPAGIQVLPTLAPQNGYADFVDTRQLIAAVSDVTISKTSTGAIITATGHTPSLGYFDAQLVPVSASTARDLVLEFRVRAPSSNVGTGSAKQRELIAARSISTGQLNALTSVTVHAANGARTTRR